MPIRNPGRGEQLVRFLVACHGHVQVALVTGQVAGRLQGTGAWTVAEAGGSRARTRASHCRPSVSWPLISQNRHRAAARRVSGVRVACQDCVIECSGQIGILFGQRPQPGLVAGTAETGFGGLSQVQAPAQVPPRHIVVAPPPPPPPLPAAQHLVTGRDGDGQRESVPRRLADAPDEAVIDKPRRSASSVSLWLPRRRPRRGHRASSPRRTPTAGETAAPRPDRAGGNSSRGSPAGSVAARGITRPQRQQVAGASEPF